ncbi:alpha-glucuronidase family glycosyl hydrolase [Jiangella asiatica]|uniref:alpha-glucuronidase family glycosyl hydrolase n=1 Tax=Jiangella asiatica TaxID=2530372 RepID=UPI00193E57F9|nr:alpha-glucuronidase family glycosyl hydrolase [Jiangella asiatica]
MEHSWTRRRFLATGGVATAGAYVSAVAPATAWEPAGSAGAPPDEDGYELWLRYRPVEPGDLLAAYRRRLTHVVRDGDAEPLASAAGELVRGLSGLLGRPVEEAPAPARDGAVVLGTGASPIVAAHVPAGDLDAVGAEGYLLRGAVVHGHEVVLVAGGGPAGVLYGAFHLLRLLQTRQPLDGLDVCEGPVNPLRLANHWDYLDRVVQWGSAGRSVFHWEELPALRPRYTDYARALASIGMNGSVVNIVNAEHEFITTEMIGNLVPLAAVFRAWGIRLYLCANFFSPRAVGGLPTADPLDEDVRAWWRAKADEIYAAIPDFGGFLVKADSEGQPGPIAYGRTHADGANMLAAALEPHGGIVMWRAFVGHEGGGEFVTAAYNVFRPLDGEFADNAIVQVKFGPIDFQVREPAHPLFGAMPNTNLVMELQVLQEYTGQGRHLCYLVPGWKEILDFDTHADGPGTTVAAVASGRAYGSAHAGLAGVMNLGDDVTWAGNHLAAANTHGYGRLAWNPELSAAEIAEEWVRMTFGSERRMVEVVTAMLLESRGVYESYTAPLMGGFTGRNHPTPPFHNATATEIGTDRTVATGTGATQVYHPPNSDIFDSVATCPEELLLVFHRLPYDHRLRSGSTLLQHIYDAYVRGVADVARTRRDWQRLAGRIDRRRHEEVLEFLDGQLAHATLWRDTCVDYLFGLTGIRSEHHRWVQAALPGGSIILEPPSLLLLGGWPNTLALRAGNATAEPRSVTVGLDLPDGWSGTGQDLTLSPGEVRTVDLPLTPPLAPGGAVVAPDVAGAGVPVLGTTPTDVLVAPAGQRCVLALDAGPDSALYPVQFGYRRLAPTDAWDPERGFGWVGGTPRALDRGNALDDLRREIIYDIVPRTLRVSVPPGPHDAYLLVGDRWWAPVYPTFVRSGGELLAASEENLPGGSYTWLRFGLDGGADGRDVDLELSSVDYHWELPQQAPTTGAWHLVAFALVDPDAEPPAIAVTALDAPRLLVGGTGGEVAVTVTNTTPDTAIATTVHVGVPAGWSGTDAVATVAAGETATLRAAVLPPPDPTPPVTLQVEVTAGPHSVGGGRHEVELLAVPGGDEVVLALDAGAAASPVVGTYRRLAPEDAWDAARGCGWVSGPPQSRDRGGVLDPLRRDFCNDAQTRTLRLAVPAGLHEVFVLVGDTVLAQPTSIRSGGELLAESPVLAGGAFAWLRFDLDGGAAGREADLELSSLPGQHWHLNALIMRRPARER